MPKDLLLAELIQKRPKLIWKYHDHDSLLENQVCIVTKHNPNVKSEYIFGYLMLIVCPVSLNKTDENLTEEERAAAWKEFENEKKGFMATFDNADMQG